MTSSARVLLGVDGGGTKTHALVADANGHTLGVGHAGSSNHHTVGVAAAVRAIRAAVGAARAQAGLAVDQVADAASFGLAGMDTERDIALMTDALVPTSLAARAEIVNDTELVLAAGTPDGIGVALLSGTGSISFGRNAAGAVARTGGWGYLLGDEGSGYAIGLAALRSCTQTADGRADAHALLAAVLAHWQLARAEDLLARVYGPQTTHTDIARIAEIVVALADAADPHAARMLDAAAFSLARMAETVAKRLALVAPPLALGGGLLAANEALRGRVLAELALPFGPIACVRDPATGAITRARRL
jgi:N-acetylglucosamine kinase-like BadF-type ATPase